MLDIKNNNKEENDNITKNYYATKESVEHLKELHNNDNEHIRKELNDVKISVGKLTENSNEIKTNIQILLARGNKK
ncbi:MAG: hypothetical protein ACFFG0_09500 [Candidatus Thorarchaeota archaeon]